MSASINEVKNPVAIIYGWPDNPEGAWRCNSKGLPAALQLVIQTNYVLLASKPFFIN
jgi:hypothetical protein